MAKSLCYFHGYCIGKDQKSLEPFLGTVPDEKMSMKLAPRIIFVRHSLSNSLSLSRRFLSMLFFLFLFPTNDDTQY
jgi:hypothetical protein